MNPYWSIGALIGVPVFSGSWIYCVVTYGFMLGVVFGWIPSAIVAYVATALWPVIALGVLWLVLH